MFICHGVVINCAYVLFYLSENLPGDDEEDTRVPLICSQRWILAYIGFLGFGVVYALRVNISVAIVCMLKQSNDTDNVLGGNLTEDLDTECGYLQKDSESYDVSISLTFSCTTDKNVRD